MKPNRSYVHGFGKGHRHADYYPDSKDKRKERKKVGESELKRALQNVNAEIAAEVDKKVEERVNAIGKTMYADFGDWVKGGCIGEPPRFNMAAAMSNVVPAATAPNPTEDASPAATARRSDQGPSTSASAPRQPIPSISATVRGPSPLAELNALKVIQTRKVSKLYVLAPALDRQRLTRACSRRPTRHHAHCSSV